MTQPLVDRLNETRAAPDDIVQAWAAVLATREPDVSTEDMRDELTAAIGADRLSGLLTELTGSARTLDTAGLLLLAAAFEDTDDPGELLAILDDSRRKMPVVEVGVVSMSCLYGLYLLMTKGVKHRERKIIKRKDGSYEISEVTDYVEMGGFFTTLSRLFTHHDPR